ncbi:hypothetical protein ACOKM3_14185 [Streptomyces sp. BH106]|uniref:hypothetical protein n=1 Tax=Streptomyces sp. BH106 TaxID=3410409 RepID=UPI003CF5F159
MPLSEWRGLSPDTGALNVQCERRFRLLVEDEQNPDRPPVLTVLACPVCGGDTGMRIAFQVGADFMPEIECPCGAVWVEARIAALDWEHYCRHRAGQTDPDGQQLVDRGFGEEAPPPIDHVKELTEAGKYLGKRAKSEARKRVKAQVRAKVTKPLKRQVETRIKAPTREAGRKAVKAAKNQAYRPVAAGVRTAWTMQAGGVPAAPPERQSGAARDAAVQAKAAPKTPPLREYRKAAPDHFPRPSKVTTGLQNVQGSGITNVTQSVSGGGTSHVSVTGLSAKEQAAVTAMVATTVREARESMTPGRTGSGSNVHVHGRNNGSIQDVDNTRSAQRRD